MTSEEMRIVVAIDQGWKQIAHDYYEDGIAFVKDGQTFASCDVPDYPSDLNAILPLLPKNVVIQQWGVDGKTHWHIAEGKPGTQIYVEGENLALAACEFYLRVKGLWKE